MAGWGAVATGEFITTVVHPSGSPADAAWCAFTSIGGILASHALRAVILARNWRRLPWRGVATRCAFSSVALGSALTLLLVAIELTWFPEETMAATAYSDLLVIWFTHIFLLLGWCALYFGIHYYDELHRVALERAELSAAMNAAQLRALRDQINPHCLFNSLNSLRALIPPESEQARDAVTLIADLLRASLVDGQKALIPLSREMETVDNYLALEQLRHEARLRIRRDIQPAALRREVPPFLLQMLVENAVKHGIAPREDGGEIRLRAEVDGDRLCLTVTNPGRLDTDHRPGLRPRVGLANARERIRLIFGAEGTLTLRQSRADEVEALVRLPLHPVAAPNILS